MMNELLMSQNLKKTVFTVVNKKILCFLIVASQSYCVLQCCKLKGVLLQFKCN